MEWIYGVQLVIYSKEVKLDKKGEEEVEEGVDDEVKRVTRKRHRK